jgi:hypothetical protein
VLIVRIAALALLLALLISGCALAQSKQETPQAKPGNQSAANEQRGTESAPVFIKVPGPTSEKEARYEHYEKEEKPANERSIANATTALAWITGVLAFFTGALWLATYRLARDAKEAAARQAIDMQNSLRIANESVWAELDSAGSAKRAANIMADTAKRQLRAYIFEHADTDNTKQCPEGWVVDVEIRNAGQTPAYDVRCASTLRPLIDPLPKDFEFNPPVFDEGMFVVNPGIPRANSVKTEFMVPSDRTAVGNGDKVLYLWGRIEYVDVFERPHFAEYRLRFQVEVRGDNIFGQWVYCAQGNDVDRDKQS